MDFKRGWLKYEFLENAMSMAADVEGTYDFKHSLSDYSEDVLLGALRLLEIRRYKIEAELRNRHKVGKNAHW